MSSTNQVQRSGLKLDRLQTASLSLTHQSLQTLYEDVKVDAKSNKKKINKFNKLTVSLNCVGSLVALVAAVFYISFPDRVYFFKR